MFKCACMSCREKQSRSDSLDSLSLSSSSDSEQSILSWDAVLENSTHPQNQFMNPFYEPGCDSGTIVRLTHFRGRLAYSRQVNVYSVPLGLILKT